MTSFNVRNDREGLQEIVNRQGLLYGTRARIEDFGEVSDLAIFTILTCHMNQSTFEQAQELYSKKDWQKLNDLVAKSKTDKDIQFNETFRFFAMSYFFYITCYALLSRDIKMILSKPSGYQVTIQRTIGSESREVTTIIIANLVHDNDYMAIRYKSIEIRVSLFENNGTLWCIPKTLVLIAFNVVDVTNVLIHQIVTCFFAAKDSTEGMLKKPQNNAQKCGLIFSQENGKTVMMFCAFHLEKEDSVKVHIFEHKQIETQVSSLLNRPTLSFCDLWQTVNTARQSGNYMILRGQNVPIGSMWRSEDENVVFLPVNAYLSKYCLDILFDDNSLQEVASMLMQIGQFQLLGQDSDSASSASSALKEHESASSASSALKEHESVSSASSALKEHESSQDEGGSGSRESKDDDDLPPLPDFDQF